MRSVSGLDRPALQWLFVACGVLLIAVAVWTGVALVRTRKALDVARANAVQAQTDRDQTDAALARERSAREALTLQLGRERQSAAPPTVPTLTLSPVRTKSPKGPETAVPTTTAPVVQLRLVLPPHTPTNGTFSITLRSWTTGDVLWSRGMLHAGDADGKPAVVASITSDVLAAGAYELVLSAGSPASELAVYEVSFVAAGRR